jgi:hypothetical protein
MQKAIFVAVLALLVGAGTWFFLFGDDAGPGIAVAEDAMSRRSEPETAVAGAGQVADTTVADATASVDPSARDAVLTANIEGRPLPDDAERITITVVDPRTDTPVAGAKVFWHDQDVWQLVQALPEHELPADPETLWRDHERLAALVGWQTRSDRDGKATIAVTAESQIRARAEGTWGMLVLRRNAVEPPTGHRLLLQPDVVVQVRVLDAEGRAACDVPVQLVPIDAKGAPVRHFGWQALARTRAPDGIATIEHLQSLRHEAANDQGIELDTVRWHVRAALPGNDDPGEPLDLENAPTEPITLRLPPCGSVHVRAVLAGQPAPGFRQASMHSRDERGERGRRKFEAARSERVAEDGVARFQHVPLQAALWVGSNTGGYMHAQCNGPAQAGQVVEVTLKHADESLLLRGRLVDAERQPIVSRNIQGQLRGPELHNWLQFRTEADGTFMVTAGTSRKNNALEQCFFTLQRPDQPPLRADVSPRTLRPGIEDLGDVVLVEPKALVGGRFVQPDGAPFTKPVSVWVEREEPTRDGKGMRWRHMGTEEFFDKQGNFRIYALTEPKRHRLNVHTVSALHLAPTDFVPGCQDLILTLTPGKPMAASVLLPAKALTHLVQATLKPAGASSAAAKEGQPKEVTTQPQQQADERFDLQWGALTPGTYALEIRLWTQKTPLVTFTDIEVPQPAGGDPRLVDIDLRPLVRMATLEIVDAEGKPAEIGDGMLVAAGLPIDSEWEGYPIDGPRSELLLPPGAQDWVVLHPGYRPQPVHIGGDKTTVRMERWPTIDVVVNDIPQLPEGAVLQAAAKLDGAPKLRYKKPWDSGETEDLLAPEGDAVPLENGRAKLPVGDGMHSLSLSLRLKRKSYEFGGVTPAKVMSTAGSVALQVPAEEWEKAKAAVQAKDPAPKPK